MYLACLCNFNYEGVLQQQYNFLPVATPALKRDDPNMLCVYARVGEEKETQQLSFWELIWGASMRPVGGAWRSLTR